MTTVYNTSNPSSNGFDFGNSAYGPWANGPLTAASSQPATTAPGSAVNGFNGSGGGFAAGGGNPTNVNGTTAYLQGPMNASVAQGVAMDEAYANNPLANQGYAFDTGGEIPDQDSSKIDPLDALDNIMNTIGDLHASVGLPRDFTDTGTSGNTKIAGVLDPLVRNWFGGAQSPQQQQGQVPAPPNNASGQTGQSGQGPSQADVDAQWYADNPQTQQAQQPQVPSNDEGGEIPDGLEQPEGEAQQAPDIQAAMQNPQARQLMLGAGALPSQIVQQKEQAIDPTGTMPDAYRRLLAAGSADPQTAGGLLQFYRGKYARLGALAAAAAQGTPNQAANPEAAAKFANMAMSNVVNGKSVHFAPVGNGKIAMSVHNLLGNQSESHVSGGSVGFDSGGVVEEPYRNKWRAKNGKHGDPNSQKATTGGAKSYDDGGDIENPNKRPPPAMASMADGGDPDTVTPDMAAAVAAGEQQGDSGGGPDNTPVLPDQPSTSPQPAQQAPNGSQMDQTQPGGDIRSQLLQQQHAEDKPVFTPQPSVKEQALRQQHSSDAKLQIIPTAALQKIVQTPWSFWHSKDPDAVMDQAISNPNPNSYGSAQSRTNANAGYLANQEHNGPDIAPDSGTAIGNETNATGTPNPNAPVSTMNPQRQTPAVTPQKTVKDYMGTNVPVDQNGFIKGRGPNGEIGQGPSINERPITQVTKRTQQQVPYAQAQQMALQQMRNDAIMGRTNAQQAGADRRNANSVTERGREADQRNAQAGASLAQRISAGQNVTTGELMKALDPTSGATPDDQQFAHQELTRRISALGQRQQGNPQQRPANPQVAAPPAPPDPAARKPGTVYQSPTGALGRWNGTGWDPVSQ